MGTEWAVCGAEVKGGEARTSGGGQPCPYCGGALVPLRGTWRCDRCGFQLCQGCEAGDAVGSPVESD